MRATATTPFSCWSTPMIASATNSRDIATSRLAQRQRMIENICLHSGRTTHRGRDLSDRRGSFEGCDHRRYDITRIGNRSGDVAQRFAGQRGIPVSFKSLDFCYVAMPGLDLRRRDLAKQCVVLVRHPMNVHPNHRHVALFDGILAVFHRLLEYLAEEPR